VLIKQAPSLGLVVEGRPTGRSRIGVVWSELVRLPPEIAAGGLPVGQINLGQCQRFCEVRSRGATLVNRQGPGDQFARLVC
jgi:hypothetical protein